jgi:hypothetical protein
MKARLLVSFVLQEAMAHFADHCAPCHGNDGNGDTLYGKGLYPKPPDLRLAETQKLSDGELFWIIENGIRFTGMPAFAPHGSQDDWKLVLFIRLLPQLTMEERVEMERDNRSRRGRTTLFAKGHSNTRKIIISEGWRSVEETPTSCPFFNLVASSSVVT